MPQDFGKHQPSLPPTNNREEALQTLIGEIERLHSSSDLSRKVVLCQTALELVNRTAQPGLWGALQNNLALSLDQNPLGNHAENLEQAILHYQQALEAFAPQAFPQAWAGTLYNPKITYPYRKSWADVQYNLASAYLVRIRGERADNLEQAVLHYLQALQVYTRQAFPELWARTQRKLGNTYLKRIRGEQAENLEQVIFHYEQALQVYTRQAFPEQWVATHYELAYAYHERIRGEQAENLEQVIFHYEQALQVCTRQAFPEQWANMQHNLGLAYYQRVQGERTENLKQAISHYKQALQVRTPQAFPEEWAETQLCLELAQSLIYE